MLTSVLKRICVLMGLMAVLFGYTGSLLAEDAFKYELLTEAHQEDPLDGLVVQGQYLYVSKWAVVTVDRYHRIEVYDTATNKLVKVLNFEHSARELKRFGNGVMALGFTMYPEWAAHYSVIQLVNESIEVSRRYDFPQYILAQKFAADPAQMDQMYFTYYSGERESVYQKRGDQLVDLHVPLHNAWALEYLAGYLFALEVRGFNAVDDSIVRINPRTMSKEYTLSTYRSGLKNMIAMPELQQLAVADRDANEVLLVDAVQNKVVRTLPIAAQHPHSLLQVGRCLAVGSIDSRVLAFYDLLTDNPNPVLQWDLSVLGEKLFSKLRNVAFDPQSNKFFVRSMKVCQGCPQPTENRVFVVEDLQGAVAQKCKDAGGMF